MAASVAPDATPAGTAFAAALARFRRRFSRTLVFMVVLCLGIGLLLSAIERRAFGPHLVYSFGVGLSCWLLMDATRLVLAFGVDRLRSARGQPLSAAGFDHGWRGVVPAMLASVLLGPLIGMSIGDAVTGNRSPSLLSFSAGNTRLTLVLTLLGSVLSVFTLSTLERLSAARANAESAQRQAAENQLRLLQSQLEPHMLFNTLANLRVLIGIDPDRAQAMLDRMIAFLRATLAASRTDAHPLAAEFDRIADYLSLIQVRMGARLAVALDLPDALRALPVPPLLLQPLVENAVKHGLEPKVDGGRIVVTARHDGTRLLLTVCDTGVGLGAAADSGGTHFGLQQVRERLSTLYGATAQVVLEPGADGVGSVARLALPVALR